MGEKPEPQAIDFTKGIPLPDDMTRDGSLKSISPPTAAEHEAAKQAYRNYLDRKYYSIKGPPVPKGIDFSNKAQVTVAGEHFQEYVRQEQSNAPSAWSRAADAISDWRNGDSNPQDADITEVENKGPTSGPPVPKAPDFSILP